MGPFVGVPLMLYPLCAVACAYYFAVFAFCIFLDHE